MDYLMHDRRIVPTLNFLKCSTKINPKLDLKNGFSSLFKLGLILLQYLYNPCVHLSTFFGQVFSAETAETLIFKVIMIGIRFEINDYIGKSLYSNSSLLASDQHFVPTSRKRVEILRNF